ncbi:MAG TPA: hypothetical protein VGA49_02960, partial [Patescibacteria group bacterium]
MKINQMDFKEKKIYMSNFIKKAFTVGVVMTTIVWSLGLAAFPLTAGAQTTIAAGDLITAPGTQAVYYYDGTNRWVFTNDKNYWTWYKDFLSVKEITDLELGDIPIGGNVVYQAGRRMVKITTDPKTYLVGENGMLHHVTSEQLAMDMFGASWNQAIDDVSDAFFTNYQIGAAITDLSNLPVGAYFMSGGNRYYVDDSGVLRLDFPVTAFNVAPNFIGAEFMAALAGSADLPDTSGATPVANYTDFLGMVPNASGTAGVPTPGPANVTATLSLPSGTQTVLTNQGSTWLGTVNFNNAGSATTLDSYHVSLGGALGFNSMGNVWGVFGGEPTNNPLNFASSTRDRQVFVNKALPAGSSSLQIYASGTVNGGGSTGSFDINNVMVAGGTLELNGMVPINRSITAANTLTLANGATPPTGNIGGTNQEVFNFTANFGRAGTLDRIFVYESGTGDVNKLDNCQLTAQTRTINGNVVGSYVDFNFG